MRGVKLSDIWPIIRDAFTAFNQDRAPRLGAALSFYAISSIGPLLVLLVSIAGLVLGRDEVQQQLFNAIQSAVGPATNVQDVLGPLLKSATRSSTNITSTIIGAVILFFTATGLFIQLQDALNSLWGADPPPRAGFWTVVRSRLLSFALVLVFVVLIIVFIVGNTFLSAYAEQLGNLIGAGAFFARLGTLLISVALFTGLFAVVYKYLPDVRLSWGDVRFGALVTALLFTAGQALLGFYFGRYGASSVPGAVGSLVALLAWIYYSSQIVFFGAEITWAYSQRRGTRAGGAASPDKKLALARQGSDIDPTPSAKERAAAARTPGADSSAQSSFSADVPEAVRPELGEVPAPLPGAGQLLLRALLALLALPALPVVLLIRRFWRR